MQLLLLVMALALLPFEISPMSPEKGAYLPYEISFSPLAKKHSCPLLKIPEKNRLKPHLLSSGTRKDLPPKTFYISDEVSDYINEVLSAFKEHSINSETFNWDEFKYCVYYALDYYAYTWQTHLQMQQIVQWLGDKHSHFSSPSTFQAFFTKENYHLEKITARILEDNIAYLKVPQTHCESGEYASKMRASIRKLNQNKPEKWIIDLRGNLGGNCWEMLAGLSPLLDQGTCGFFGKEVDEELIALVHKTGELTLKDKEGESLIESWEDIESLHNKDPYIAILINNETASAGETVAIAFRGNPKVKHFGTKTSGLSTGITLCTLSDNSVLGIASCYNFDKTKHIYVNGLEPDVAVHSDKSEDCLNKAIDWLKHYNKAP